MFFNLTRYERGSTFTYIFLGKKSDTWPGKVDKTIVIGSNPRGCPRKTWLEYMRNELKVESWEALLAQNRIAWCWSLNPKSRYGRDSEVVKPSDTGNNSR